MAMTQPHVEKKWSMKASIELIVFFALFVFAVVLLAPKRVWADDPTSRYVSLTPIPTRNLPASSTNGVAVQFQIWDAATGGNLISTEPHTVDTNNASNITNDHGFTDLLLGRGQPGGLSPNNYLPGQSRYLDVIYVATGTSVLTARIPLYASAFSISPGPQGPAGPQGPVGPQGPAGPASAITGVTAGTNLIGGGTTGNVTLNLNVAATDARYAQLGASNTFAASQNVNGNFFSSGSIGSGNSLTVSQSCQAARCISWASAFFADSLGNTTNSGNTTTFGNTQTYGLLRSENGGLSLGGTAALSVDAPGKPGGRFTVLPNGNVGIGTTTPGYTLDVAGSAHVGGNSLRVEGGISAGGQYAVAVDGLEGLVSQFQTPTEVPGGRFMILPNGNVGIGNPSPQNRLDVRGNVGASGTLITGSDITSNGQILAQSNIVSGARVIASKGFLGMCMIPGTGPVQYAGVSCDVAFDLAEMYPSLEPTEPGDVLIVGYPSSPAASVRRSTGPYDGRLLGVVSTSPGLVLEGEHVYMAGDNTKLITANTTVVGLAGRVPVKVSMENGPVLVGDPLTSSSTPGVAMKATRAGKVLGYALESMSMDGKVLVFVEPGYYIPPKQLDLLNRIDELETQVSELQGLKAQALEREAELEQDRSRLTETVDVLKARLERLERAFGSRVVAARAE
jgi:hypothetical protein